MAYIREGMYKLLLDCLKLGRGGRGGRRFATRLQLFDRVGGIVFGRDSFWEGSVDY